MLKVTSGMLDISHETLMLLLKTSTVRLLADCLAECTDILHLNKKTKADVNLSIEPRERFTFQSAIFLIKSTTLFWLCSCQPYRVIYLSIFSWIWDTLENKWMNCCVMGKKNTQGTVVINEDVHLWHHTYNLHTLCSQISGLYRDTMLTSEQKKKWSKFWHIWL